MERVHADHAPPHFHARYGEFEAIVGIERLAILQGELPTRARRLVVEWAGFAPRRTGTKLAEGEVIGSVGRHRPPAMRRGREEQANETAVRKVASVTVVRPYLIDVTFTGGFERRVDAEPLLRGPVFAPLRDPDLFAQASVDPGSGTVSWPTGADLAPEFLYYGDETPYGRIDVGDPSLVPTEPRR